MPKKKKETEKLRHIDYDDLLCTPLIAKLVLRSDTKGKKLPGHQKILVAGVIVAPGDITGSKEDQLWECQVLLIPKKKFEEFRYKGASIEDVITNGFEKRENWRREIPL